MPQFGRYNSGPSGWDRSLDIIKTSTGIINRHEQTALAKERQGLDERKFTEDKKAVGLQQGLAERKQTLDEKKFKAEVPVPERQMDAGEFTQLKALGGVIGKKLGFRLNSVTPIANKMEEYTKQGYAKIDVYRAIRGDWKNLMADGKKSIQKAMETALASNDVTKVNELTQLDTEISNESFVDKMMPACAKYEKDLQKQPEKERDKWETKTLPNGARISINRETGEEKKVLGRPSKGGKSGSGQTPQEKRLKSLKDNFYKQITQERSAAKGIDFTNVAMGSLVKEVSADAREKAKVLADEYVKEGGKLEDLGLTKEDLGTEKQTAKKYKSDKAVRDAFKKGTLTEKEAEKILQKQFGYK